MPRGSAGLTYYSVSFAGSANYVMGARIIEVMQYQKRYPYRMPSLSNPSLG
jgi:hypothetical protein